ncbi:MAG: hypothetical protein JO119_03480 [Acidobacteria bacterium]|nr:hypothetical protein [Acidobacteriota bacterium]
MSPTAHHRTLTVIGIFLIFAMSMASLAAITLTFPGTPLDFAWKLNPHAYTDLKPLGPIIGIPFFLLALSLGISAIGWFRRRRWGWRLATIIIAIQIAGDIINTASGHLIQGLIGATIAGALLFCLLRPSVRSAFPSSP